MYQNIPNELKDYCQWCVWRFEENEGKKPTKVPYSARTGKLASVSNPETWSSFQEALNAVSSGFFSGIGFILTENDPFAFIDLDDTEGDNEKLQKQIAIYNHFESYAERSPSGKGLHIILKGSVESGRKRSGIEIYSSARYMTMTGDVFRNAPVVDLDFKLKALWHEMAKGQNVDAFYAGLAEQKIPDEKVLEIACNAGNREKFIDLYYNGNWQKYYPSQSEADFALIDIIAFYSENRQQTQRIFLTSALGQRDKSRAQYRLNYILNRCFDRMLPPVDIEGLLNQFKAMIDENNKKQLLQSIKTECETECECSKPKLNFSSSVYSVPPGVVGEIAQFIYAQAPRPVPEIALAGAIGLMAGIVGRSYNVSGTGLNQYTLLLAPTGTGKEAIASGIDKLFHHIIKVVPAANEFIGPAEIASAQAVIKYMSKGPASFVSLVGEFGIYMQQMASVNAAPHLAGFRRFLLDAYNKSGEGKVLRPSIYSDKEKNTNAIQSPAFSLLGESTPEKFYEGLHEGLISEGLLPRFTLIEYKGDRPGLNENHSKVQPCFELVDKLSKICAYSLTLNSQHKAIQVTFTEEAQQIINEYNIFCDKQINNSEREIRRHLWNRAHMKAMKLAAIIAVGCHPFTPTIDKEIVNWSIRIINADVIGLLRRFDNGEIGVENDETKQLVKVIESIKDYKYNSLSENSKYLDAKHSKLHPLGIIPYSFLQRKLAAISIFRKDKMGSSFAIKRAITTLVERGDLQEISKATLAKDYETTARCFAISNPKTFERSVENG